MDKYSSLEKVQIVLDIAKQLKNHSTSRGAVNLYNDNYSFVPLFKKISNDYIKNDQDYKGVLEFLEIDKKIKYYLPVSRKNKAYFIIKMK